MLETQIKEGKKRIEKKLSNKLININQQSQKYIRDIITLINKKIGINKILSIILFGSQRAKVKEATSLSDCDLLIIFKDCVSNHHIKEIEKYFICLEVKHNFRDYDSSISRKIMNVLQQSTGIFVSHFLTKQKYWENKIFHKIFRVNKVFSRIFAPRNIVLGNVLINSTILLGKDLRKKVKSKIHISMLEMIKSIIMNLMISFFSIFISPLKNLKPIKYQLEATKWSLKASNYYCFRDSTNLKKISERFITFEKPRFQKRAKVFFSDFLRLRRVPRNDLRFMIRCPIRIIRMHIKGISFKKLIKKKERFRLNSEQIKPIIPDRSFPFRI
ncbi:MAG: hypothetical protein ACFFHD_10270 [Promethearchaeota archaeon]